MKPIRLIILAIAISFAGIAQAQVSINVNVGSPPMWGPAGYSNVQYYYLPDIYAYYDVPTANFIYFESGKWVRKANLPYKYRNYDLYSGYKVVLTDYRGNSPYAHFKQHKVKYAKGYRGKHQNTIGSKPGNGKQKQSNGGMKSNHNPKGNKGGKGKK